MSIHRRKFVGRMGTLAAAASLGPMLSSGRGTAGEERSERESRLVTRPLEKTYRAAAIGFTGRGGYGHGLDRVFRDLPGVEFVAIADDNEQGLQQAGARNGVGRLYADYREMLEREELDVVSVGTRHAALHEPVVVDCARAGKHIYCEKPLAVDLASNDRMLRACEQHGVKMAVALPNRASPAIQRALNMLRDGQLGTLLSMRARGKEDRRGGGEDLLVLGYHLFDLMCLFAGNPQWTFANVREGGREMTLQDARDATEPVGRVAGDWMAVMYGFPRGVHGHFESHRGLKGGSDRFSLVIEGSEGTIATRSLGDTMWFEGPIFNPAKPHRWQTVPTPEWEGVADKGHWCGQRLVIDLLHAVEEDREPYASGANARWVEEMIQSVYVSHLNEVRVALPLVRREHPLAAEYSP